MQAAAVVPAYNEETTIAPVLEVLTSHQMLKEVIVANDGSTDNTAKIAASCGAKVINLETNQGKGAAMRAGARAADAGVLLFVDADLIGFKHHHVDELLKPVLSGEVVMTVGVFKEGRLATDLAQQKTPFLSGQRAIKREVFLSIPDLETTRYGVEVAISRYFKRNQLPKKLVTLRDVSQVMKEEKRGFIKGFTHRMQMYWEIVKSLRSH